MQETFSLKEIKFENNIKRDLPKVVCGMAGRANWLRNFSSIGFW